MIKPQKQIIKPYLIKLLFLQVKQY